jgi:DNA repair ATPase RecN
VVASANNHIQSQKTWERLRKEAKVSQDENESLKRKVDELTLEVESMKKRFTEPNPTSSLLKAEHEVAAAEKTQRVAVAASTGIASSSAPTSRTQDSFASGLANLLKQIKSEPLGNRNYAVFSRTVGTNGEIMY